jgi:peptidoglycan/xylan/chitin deacetylase (PgdA/CDA1 family)
MVVKISRVTVIVAAVILTAAFAVAGCGLFDDNPSSTSLGGTTSEVQTTGSPSTSAAVSTSGSGTISGATTTARPITTLGSTTTHSSTTQPPTTVPASSTTTVVPGTTYTNLPTEEKVVALTFDAAYDPAPLKGILAALEDAEADATFFLTGEFVRDFPEYTQLILDAGYPAGNHSYSHPDFTTVGDDEIRDQIARTAAALVKLGAPDPAPLFRFPYGAYNKHVLSVIGSEGYVSVFWTIDTLDWETDRTPEQIRSVVLKNLKPGAIILMHVGSKQEVQVLPALLEEIKARGYRFVNLRDALPEASADE